VTYDLRGHGNSEKPLDAAKYRDSKAWGDEVQAVIDAAGLKRPVLVGWSYAGRVISDYLATHGAGHLAGINFVDAPIKVDPALIGDNLKNLPLMASEIFSPTSRRPEISSMAASPNSPPPTTTRPCSRST